MFQPIYYFFITSSRLIVKYFLMIIHLQTLNKKILVYGAGAGRQLILLEMS